MMIFCLLHDCNYFYLSLFIFILVCGCFFYLLFFEFIWIDFTWFDFNKITFLLCFLWIHFIFYVCHCIYLIKKEGFLPLLVSYLFNYIYNLCWQWFEITLKVFSDILQISSIIFLVCFYIVIPNVLSKQMF